MDARELRIGNYYYEASVKNKLVELRLDSHYLIEALINEINLEPIPITKEWLVKFGFIYNVKYTQELVYEFGNMQLAYNKTDGWYLGNEETELEIKSIHQLQNIYFFLYGNELKLKTKNK